MRSCVNRNNYNKNKLGASYGGAIEHWILSLFCSCEDSSFKIIMRKEVEYKCI